MKTALPDYQIRQSPRAKNLRLRVTRDEGLCVVVPRGFDESKVPAVLIQKKAWVADALKRVGEARRFLEPKPAKHRPAHLRLLAIGETRFVVYQENRNHSGIRLRAEGEKLIISGSVVSRDAAIRKLNDWLRFKVRESLFPLANDLAKKHSLRLNRLLIKSQRTRWASCSAKRNLSLNTKLLFLPPELVRYVLLHELCHTEHMNHGSEFWRLVATCEPSFRVLDRTLREAWKTVPEWTF
jgi:predicted metal-dependent hydrolase